MSSERITIDIGILQGIFGDLTKLQTQLGGLTGGMANVDRASASAFKGVEHNVLGAKNAVAGLETGVDTGMRNIVADIMGPLAKTQELEDKLRRLGGQVRTSKSVSEIILLKKEIHATQRELDGVNPSGMERKVGGAVSRMRGMLGGLVAPVAGAFAIGGVVGFTRSVVEAVSGAENFNASMKVMLGGQEQATKMSKDLREFAVATPFDIAGLRNYTTQLNAYGTSADGIIPTLDTLGNIAAGVGSDKLPQLVTAYGQVQAAGKLTGGELKQFTEAGVPLLEELARITGKKTSEMAGHIAEMDVPFDVVKQALTNMTAAGGKFHNLMAAQSQTIGGQMSAAGEAWAGFLEDLGKELLPEITSAVKFFSSALDGVRSGFTWVMENGETIKDVITWIGVAVGIYSAALLINNASLIANNALQAVAAVRMGILGGVMNVVTAATTIWTGVQWLLNAALTANPIGIVIAAIAALVAAVVYCWNEFAEFRAFIYSLWEAFKSTFGSIADYVGTVFDSIVNIAVGAGKVLQGAFTLDFDKIKEGMDQHAKGVKDLFTNIVAAPDVATNAAKKAAMAGVQGWKDGLASHATQMKEEDDANWALKAKELKANANPIVAGENGVSKFASGATPGLNANNVAPGQNVGAGDLLGGKEHGKKKKGKHGKADDDGVTVGGSEGSGRTITMNITLHNHFNMPRDANMGTREAADRLADQLFNKLNDGQYSMG